jgi:hypothetical protein
MFTVGDDSLGITDHGHCLAIPIIIRYGASVTVGLPFVPSFNSFLPSGVKKLGKEKVTKARK